MNVHHYETSGGKDLILDYVDKLSTQEKAEALNILGNLQTDGLEALEYLDTRQLKGKLWEIKFYRQNRIMYVVADEENIYLLHVCKKQKGKAEKFELDKAVRRVKELEIEINRKFV